MNLLAVLLTSNAALLKVVGTQASEIRKEVMNSANQYTDNQVTLVSFNPTKSSESFTEFLGKAIGLVENRPCTIPFQGVVVLYDSRYTNLVSEILDGIFSTSFNGNEYIEKPRNFLIRTFGILIKNLGILMNTMKDKTRMEAAILPLINFESAAFKDFINLCQFESDDRDFQNKVVPALTAVTRLRGPKRRTSYQEKYFKDDRSLCFKYGHESHSSFETGSPHTAACAIRGLFRLGVPLEQQRHFNVTTDDDKTRVSGSFNTCHDVNYLVSNRSHLNVFSNDFLK